MAATPPICDFGWKAPDFTLEGIDGRTYSLAEVRGPNGTLVMFICNHCPYVKSVIARIVRDVGELKQHGIGAVAIMSNDTETYPEDSFENMKAFAAEHGFNLPYVIDRTQEVARAYDSTGPRRWRAPTTPSVRRTSSDSTRTSSCNTGAVWTNPR
jgi:peroxiredoxin